MGTAPVDLKTLGFAAADFQITQQLSEFFQKLNPQNAGQFFSFGRSDPQDSRSSRSAFPDG